MYQCILTGEGQYLMHSTVKLSRALHKQLNTQERKETTSVTSGAKCELLTKHWLQGIFSGKLHLLTLSSVMGSLITILNIDKTKKLFFGPNQHIRMISEGSW